VISTVNAVGDASGLNDFVAERYLRDHSGE